MKHPVYLLAVAVAALSCHSSAFSREVEGASVDAHGRTSDARGGQTGRNDGRQSDGGDKRVNPAPASQPSSNQTASTSNAKSKPAAKESNFAKSAKATQKMADSIQQEINASKEKVAKLQAAADTSQTDQKIEKNTQRITKENAKQISKSLKDRITGLFKETNPVSDAMDKAKETKELGDRLIDTLSYDQPGWDTLEAMDQLEHEQKNLDKLEHTKTELEKIRDAFKSADDKFKQEQPQQP